MDRQFCGCVTLFDLDFVVVLFDGFHVTSVVPAEGHTPGGSCYVAAVLRMACLMVFWGPDAVLGGHMK